MVFGNKAPIARIEGVVPVIAHHKIIIVFEGIAIGRNAVDINPVAICVQSISFVIDDATRIYGQIELVQDNRFAFFRNPYRAEIIPGPTGRVVVGLGKPSSESVRLYMDGLSPTAPLQEIISVLG